MALLETAADRRETLLRQIYEVNRADGRGRRRRAIRRRSSSRPTASTTRARRRTSSSKLQMGGVEVYRADAAFDVGRPATTPPAPSSSR